MPAYFNENDRNAAAWLRELIRAGHIAAGDVDERSLLEVTPADVAGYDQCHFFAGIGGWSYALRLAGWGDTRNVWTGSAPCQPFSDAGRGAGFADARHLWPRWLWLISQCRPAVIFGEQVASKAGLEWLDFVHSDLENAGYAVGAADLCAAGVGAPHIRQRLYFVADRDAAGRGIERQARAHEDGPQRDDTPGCGTDGQLADSAGERHQRPADGPQQAGIAQPDQCGWHDAEWIQCSDGKQRPVEPGTFPLVDGLFGRVGLLRGYGNAIVPQVAATFIGAYGDLSRLQRA